MDHFSIYIYISVLLFLMVAFVITFVKTDQDGRPGCLE
jgi:hypothetical protein